MSKDNADDAWRRIAIYQALNGSINSDQNTNQPVFVTRSDVYRHIGAETEGSRLSFLEFCENMRWAGKEVEEMRLPSFVANGNKTLLQLCGIFDEQLSSNPSERPV